MTPITPGPQPDILDEIKALFSWNPPRLITRKRRPSISSTATGPPSFYDKHFSNKLVLKRVVRLPLLVQDLAKNVDKALDAALTTLPSLDGFIIAKYREIDMQFNHPVVTGDESIARFYSNSTGRYCLQVASTLALHPSTPDSSWHTLLFWTQSGPSSGYAIKDGLANVDGMLYFRKRDENTDETVPAIIDTIENKNRRIFEEMGESRSALATWETKSISTGGVEVMNAVLNLGSFSWTFCTNHDSLSNRKHKKAMANVKGVVVPDAQAPPWSFPSTLPPPQQSASCSSDSGSPMKDKGQKRKRDDDDEHLMIAQSLVHQAWAHAVLVDGTLIVLHFGNHELVCVRHRDSQTLYISDIIEPPTCVDPGYGKLHVGIYIAAVQDTMDRKQQQLYPISQPKLPGDGGDLIGSDQNQDNQGNNHGSGSKGGHGKRNSGEFQGSAGRKGPTDDELVAIEKTIHMATNRDVVLLYLQYDVYDSPIPASFLRSAPSIMAYTRCPTPPFSPRAIHTYGLEECLTIVLTSEIGRGGTGVVHRGTLKPEVCDGAMPLDVVVKLAFGIQQRDALRSEYAVYCRLRSKGVIQGIATVLGFFDDSEDGACALVMLYAGAPLVTEPQCGLSVSDRKSALSTLESIHRAGILHGDIRQHNILTGGSGVTIIDFGHSEHCDNQKVKDREFAELRNLLDLDA